MTLTEQIDGYINAIKWADGVHVSDLLRNAKETIEKLEQDKKILRWALMHARESILSGDSETHWPTLVSLIETAESMTEPANDR